MKYNKSMWSQIMGNFFFITAVLWDLNRYDRVFVRSWPYNYSLSTKTRMSSQRRGRSKERFEGDGGIFRDEKWKTKTDRWADREGVKGGSRGRDGGWLVPIGIDAVWRWPGITLVLFHNLILVSETHRPAEWAQLSTSLSKSSAEPPISPGVRM